MSFTVACSLRKTVKPRVVFHRGFFNIKSTIQSNRGEHDGSCCRRQYSYNGVPHMQCIRSQAIRQSSSISSTSGNDDISSLPDPRLYVEGATREDLNNPLFLDYVKANLPHIYDPNFDPEFEDEGLEVWNGVDPRVLNLVKENRREQKATMRKRREQQELDRNYPLNMRPIHSYLRDDSETNSRMSRKIRKAEKMVPGTIFGSDPTLGIYSAERGSQILIKTPKNILDREVFRFGYNFDESRVYRLTLYKDKDDEEGTQHIVLPATVQRHPTKDWLYCANFCRYHAGRPLKIPFRYINRDLSPALKTGFIIPIRRKISVIVDEGVPIPDGIDIDCTGLKPLEIIRRDRCHLPEGVHFSKATLDMRFIDFVIGKVIASNRRAALEEIEKAQAEEKK